MLQDKLISFAMVGEEAVLWLLVALSVLCLGIAVERAIFATVNHSPSSALDRVLRALFAGGSTRGALTELDQLKGMEARVLGVGLRAGEDGGAPAAEEALAGALALERLKLERGLIVLGTTGSNAPFIGLFGTVLGIMKAFKQLSMNQAEAATSVMAGISQALVATALGLLVAIPAVVLYNAFQRKNKETMTRLQSLCHLLMARLKTPELQEGGAVRAVEGV